MKELLKTIEERITTLMSVQNEQPENFDDYDLGMLQAFLSMRAWIEQHVEESNIVQLREVNNA